MNWPVLAVAALVGLMGCGLLGTAWRETQRRRAMARIPTSPTGSAAPGPVEVQGRAAPADRPVPARFTQADGVMGHWRVQELRRKGKSERWVTLHEERDAPPFHVDDGTGPILVDVEHADLDVPPTFTGHAGMGHDPPPRVLAYLRERNVPHEGWLGANRRMRFTETLVKAGDPLYVLGVAEPAPPGGKARLVLRRGSPDAPFHVSVRGEREASRRALKSAIGRALGGLAAIVGGALLGLDAAGVI